MRWNPFDLVSPAINRTKDRLLPFNFKEWFKLSLISALANGVSSNFNSGGSANSGFSPSNSGSNSTLTGAADNIKLAPVDVGQTIRDAINKYWIIGGVFVAFFLLIATFMSYMKSVFNFIFVEELVVKKTPNSKPFIAKFVILNLLNVFVFSTLAFPFFYNLIRYKTIFYGSIGASYLIFSIIALIITGLAIFLIYIFSLDISKSFKSNNSSGISLFLFNFIIGLISLIVIAALALPYVSSFMKGKAIIASLGWGYIIFSIFALLIYFLIIGIVYLFVYDFVVPYMYVKKTPAFFSWKQVWKIIFENKTETFVYWLARIVLGLGIAILVGILALAVTIVMAIVGLAIFVLGFILFKVGVSLILLVLFGLVLALAIITVWGLIINLLSMPVSIFLKYFSLMNFEKLTNIKIIK